MSLASTRLIAIIILSALGTSVMLWLGGRDLLMTVLATLEQRLAMFTVAFTAWALIANCLVLPAGSLSLVAGGAVLGAALPAGMWFAAQLATAPFIYRTTVAARLATTGLIERYLGAGATLLLSRAADDGVWLTAVLRLTPVIPSAPAAMIAASAGVTFKSFMLGSALAGWVRPLYFASIGATAGSLLRAADVSTVFGWQMLAPLTILCLASAALFGARLYIKASKP